MSIVSESANSASKRALIIGAIFAVFFLIVLLNITRTSVWGDEGFSVMTIGGGEGVRASMAHFWELIMKDNHPFLYNFLLYFYAKAFGYSDGVLRFFSALWICAGAIVSYLLLRRYESVAGGGHISILYLLLFMLAPNTIYYAQELRNYGMILGLSSIFCVLYFLIREYIYHRFETPHIRAYFFVLVCAGVALVLTHYYAYIFVFAAGCALLLECFIRRECRFKVFMSFAIIGLAGVIWLFLHCYIGDFHMRIVGASRGESWIYEGSVASLLLSMVVSMLGKYGYGAIVIALLYGVVAHRTSLFECVKAHLGLCFPIVIEMIIVALMFVCVTKTMTTRYFIELFPFMYIFVALLLCCLGRRAIPFAFLVALCLAGHSFFISKNYEKEDIREASAYIQSHFKPAQCKLPVSWISYARYLPQFEFVEKPLWQEDCDLILLSCVDDREIESDFKELRAYLAKQGIMGDYHIIEIHKAAIVLKGEARNH